LLHRAFVLGFSLGVLCVNPSANGLEEPPKETMALAHGSCWGQLIEYLWLIAYPFMRRGRVDVDGAEGFDLGVDFFALFFKEIPELVAELALRPVDPLA
jgi:hypothetical protein